MFLPFSTLPRVTRFTSRAIPFALAAELESVRAQLAEETAKATSLAAEVSAIRTELEEAKAKLVGVYMGFRVRMGVWVWV